MMKFEEYLEKMELRRKREKELEINAELRRNIRTFTREETVARMFLMLGCRGETRDLTPAHVEKRESAVFLG